MTHSVSTWKTGGVHLVKRTWNEIEDKKELHETASAKLGRITNQFRILIVWLLVHVALQHEMKYITNF